MMNRFKKLAPKYLLLGVLISCCYTGYSQDNDPPNIILIMTDQHQARALSIAGNTDLKTPNIDGLATSGMRFNKAYSTFPLCTPARSSIFTGQMPHNLGIKSNKGSEAHITADAKKTILANVLKSAGYDCAYGGKWHAHEASMVSGNGFEMIAPMGDIGLAEKSIEYLKSKKNSNKPFFLTISYDNPHNICEWARNEPLPYGDIPAVSLENTPELPVNFKQSTTFPEALKIEQIANKKVYPTANYTREDWRQYRHAYYRLVEKVDAEIGKILDALDTLDMRKNTLIIFTSDHGDGNASHGWNQKTSLFQESTNVPFIVSYPGKIKKNKQNSSLISNGLDLYPTLLDYAQIEIPTALTGLSLKPVFEGKEKKTNRDYVVVETKFAGNYAFGTMGRSVVGKRFKYNVYNWGKNREQLFDLKNDPFEMTNLIKDKAYLETVDLFRDRLYKWCIKTADKQFLRKIVLPSTSEISTSTLFDKPY
ncbi:MAG: sulfatase-like hydrolase/transferase [Flavobacteriaceae bacterium]|nr:sulfatase-like hydrolase/transferase [Flavobacteriaceae bacterium]